MSRHRWFAAAVILGLVLLSCTDSRSGPVEPSVGLSESLSPSPPAFSHQGSDRVPAPRNFVAPLEGAQEVPPVDTRARGMAHFQLSRDGSEVSYRLIVANIEDVLMAHIHLAPAGVNGPVVVWLYPDTPPPQLIEGRFSGVLATGTFDASDLVGPLAGADLEDLLDAMAAEGTYVNVHTADNPPGEIRGQIAVSGPR
jgi:hypothetical protein